MYTKETADDIERYIRDNFPKCEIYDDIDSGLPYAIAGDFAKYTVATFAAGDMPETVRCLELVEELCGSNDHYISELGAVGYIEDMSNYICYLSEDKQIEFYEMLGKASKYYWDEVEKFWTGQIPCISEYTR